jgi:hypothetical protein
VVAWPLTTKLSGKWEIRAHKEGGVGPPGYCGPFHSFIGKDTHEGFSDITDALRRLRAEDQNAEDYEVETGEGEPHRAGA